MLLSSEHILWHTPWQPGGKNSTYKIIKEWLGIFFSYQPSQQFFNNSGTVPQLSGHISLLGEFMCLAQGHIY